MTASSHKIGKSEPEFFTRLFAGDRVALARALTAVESEGGVSSYIMRAIFPHLGRAHVIGVTGAPGAGKSTLVNAYIGELRRRGRSVGVVAVDPSSPHSGGAILGDRIRMTEHSGDAGVFVRSLASQGHLGGLSRVASRAIDVMDAAGRDVVIVETVGAGQSEIEIAEIADTKIVVTAPGLGDEIQALKAGILEIADILVVNKADLPHARRAALQLESMLGYSEVPAWRAPVIRTSATRGEGVAALADEVEKHGQVMRAKARTGEGRTDPRRRVHRLLAAIAGELARRDALGKEDGAVAAICEKVLKGELSFDDGAREILSSLYH